MNEIKETTANDYRNRHRKKNYSKGNFSDGSRKRWLDSELDMLYTSQLSDRDLAKQLKRSVQSIQVKRCKELRKEHI